MTDADTIAQLRAILAVTDKLLLAEAQQSLDRLARAEAAEAEIAELKLDAASRDVRVFELKEELDNAEAKLAERDAENARLRESLQQMLIVMQRLGVWNDRAL